MRITSNPVFLFAFLMFIGTETVGQPLNSEQRDRMINIRSAFNNLLFVNRFESIESPCLYIDSVDDRVAHTGDVINSNYRSLLLNKRIDPNGVKCLSNNYAKYLQFKVDSTELKDLTIQGEVMITYGYPASSIMQYLCRNGLGANNDSFFVKLLKSKGWFKMYPEKDKYVLSLVIQEKPYDRRDTAYAFLEITSDFFKSNKEPSYNLIFDRISLDRGDRNNQLSLRFTSTNVRNELMYYTQIAYDVLHDTRDLRSQAYITWLRNYLTNPACIHCDIIYSVASRPANGFILPNTRPQPAH